MNSQAVLELRNVSLRLGKEPEGQILLNDVSARFSSGHFVAVIGPSGCGKSTLLKVIAGLREPTSGSVHWEERDLATDDLDPHEIGYVPQFSIAYDLLTVAESVESTLRLRVADLDAEAREERVAEILNHVGLGELRDRRVQVLSGGQKRRLALAMEMVTSPLLLLADEVTSGLDPKAEDEIVRLLKRIAQEDERIVISVTHSLRHADLYDSVLVLHQGHVVYHGPARLLYHYFSVQNPEDLFPRLAERAAADWHASWLKHRGAYLAPGAAETVAAPRKESIPRIFQRPSLKGARSHLPKGEPEGMPGFLSQFAILLARRWQLFFRDRGQVMLQLALLFGFPCLVVIFALNGLPQIKNLNMTAQTDLRQMMEEASFHQESARTGSLVSGLVMFQVVLLTLMGSNNSAREIAAERLIFEKEKYGGVRPSSYVLSKAAFLSVLVAAQSIWMAVFVNVICHFPGDFVSQAAMLIMVNAAMTAICLGISSLANTPEQASLISVYLVGFQLPLSGAVLALPDAIGWITRPFIAAYWSWSGFLQSMRETRLYRHRPGRNADASFRRAALFLGAGVARVCGPVSCLYRQQEQPVGVAVHSPRGSFLLNVCRMRGVTTNQTLMNSLPLRAAALFLLLSTIRAQAGGYAGAAKPSGPAPSAAEPAPAAQRPPEIPIKQFFDNPKISSALISPDAKQYAFLAPDNNRMNVWVCPADDFAKATVITHDTKRGISSFTWTRDGKYVLYMQDQGGNENFHIYRVDPLKPDAPAVDLTPEEGARAEFVDLPRERPDEALVALNARDKHYFDVYHLRISTGELKMIEQNPGDVDSWDTDTHGVLRACAAQIDKGQTQIRVRDGATGPFRVLATYTDEEAAEIYAFTPDGTALFFSSARGTNTSHLAKLDLKTGAETLIDEDPEYDLEGPIISDKTHELLGVTYNKDRLSYKMFDPQMKKDLDILQKVHDGDVLFRDSDADEQHWIIAFNSPTDPGATYSYDRATGATKFLYRPRPWLKPEELVDMKPIQFDSVGGLTIHGYLTLPKGVEPKNLPTVLVVHGGPWARDDWGYDAEVQYLANRGFAVLQVNYRGSTGYGKKFLHAGDREWGGKMLDDMVAGVNWAVAQGYSDKDRIGIYGGSYGGYATLAALAFQPKEFKCGVDYVGISNLLTFMNTIPPYWETYRDVMYRRVGNPKTEEAFLRSRSPLFAVDKIEAPLFIAQGFNDPRVNHAEAEQIVKALQDAHKPVEYMVKMDEGHGFMNPENRLDFYGKMEAFLAKYLQPK